MSAAPEADVEHRPVTRHSASTRRMFPKDSSRRRTDHAWDAVDDASAGDRRIARPPEHGHEVGDGVPERQVFKDDVRERVDVDLWQGCHLRAQRTIRIDQAAGRPIRLFAAINRGEQDARMKARSQTSSLNSAARHWTDVWLHDADLQIAPPAQEEPFRVRAAIRHREPSGRRDRCRSTVRDDSRRSAGSSRQLPRPPECRCRPRRSPRPCARARPRRSG